MRIFRYELDITDHQVLQLPMSYEILSVAVSRTAPNTKIDMWALVPEVAPRVDADIWIFGTGHPMPPIHRDVFKFLGTVVAPNSLVWHVFEAHA